MLKKIADTLGTKIVAAILSLATVMLTTHILGPEGRGEISLVNADIALVVLFIQLVGGPSLVYLFPRENSFQLWLFSSIWTLILPIVVVPVMHSFHLISDEYQMHILLISILMGLSSSNQILLLGAEKVNYYNRLNLLQISLLFVLLISLFFVFDKQQNFSYFIAVYGAYGIGYLCSFFFLWSFLKKFSFAGFLTTAKKAFVKGATVQFSNLIQFLNYRLSFFFLSNHKAELGIFSVTLVLAEAVWLIGNSISLVQYSSISNETNREDSIRHTFILAKVSFWATGCCVLLLALLPEICYELLFGKRFGEAKQATLALCPGILAIGLGMIFSHYFAGTGRFRINNYAALAGLCIKIPACFLLVDRFSDIGASVACSLSYITSFTFLLYRFSRETGFKWNDLKIRKEEIQLLRNYLQHKIT